MLLTLAVLSSCAGGGDTAAPAAGPAPAPPGPEYAAALAQADGLLSQGDLQGALRASTQALLAAPALSEPYERVSSLYSQMGRHDQGAGFFTMAAERFPRQAEPAFYQGIHLYQLARWDEALAAFDRCVALRSDMSEAHFQRGVVLQAKADFDGAIAALQRAGELSPRDPFIAVRLARMLRVAGRYDEARTVVEGARRLSPGVPAVHYALGQVLQRVGTDEEAEAAYRRAIELDPGHRRARHDLGRLLARNGRNAEARVEQVLSGYMKKVEEERAQLVRLVGLSEQDPAPALALADLEISAGRLSEVTRWVGRAEALGADGGAVSRLRARVAYLSGDPGGGDAELGGAAEGPLMNAHRELAKGNGGRVAELLGAWAGSSERSAAELRAAASLHRRLDRLDPAVDLLERAARLPSVLEPFAGQITGQTPG
ncbi:hypothetical protein ABI59_00935 [Acidobacteria bacterium Mor1]|nr:hypothetical protein ABI59_00935 [Acidobacteria bacterium Mor1]